MKNENTKIISKVTDEKFLFRHRGLPLTGTAMRWSKILP